MAIEADACGHGKAEPQRQIPEPIEKPREAAAFRHIFEISNAGREGRQPVSAPIRRRA